MRSDGLFIAIEVDDAAATDPTVAEKLAEVCPVDIFADAGGSVELLAAHLDECVLCRLCLDAVGDKVKVIKLYDDGATL